MAFNKYQNGAWMEPEDNVRRYQSSAWTDCESAKRYKNGAWEELWANIKYMVKKSDDITHGLLQIEDKGLKFSYYKFASEWNGKVSGTLNGSGTIVFYLDGNWTNPSVSFDWIGGLLYIPTGYSYYNRVPAGHIYPYTRTASGAETIGTTALATIGSVVNGENYSGLGSDSGKYSGTLNGTFNRVGLAISTTGYAGNLIGHSSIDISNLLINGKKVGFPADAAFDRQDWDYN